MEKTIIIAEIKDTEKWYNVTDNAGITYGINKEKAAKLSEQLKTAKQGDSLTGNAVEKDGKRYLWDPNEKKGGGKTFAPKDKSFEAAMSAAEATGNMLGLTKDVTPEQFDKWFEHIHAKIMSKAIKPTTENK
jgi:hypothetical protein